MKQSFFIDSTGKLKWISKMPTYTPPAYVSDQPDLICNISESEYEEALEIAKKEAVEVDEPIRQYFDTQHRRRVNSVHPEHNFKGNLGYRGMLIPGEIYIIDMEEEIELVKYSCNGTLKKDEIECPYSHAEYPDCCGMQKKFACIKPKKAEESEHQWVIWRDAIEIPEKMRGMEDYEVIQELEKHFEIKRKA